MARAPVAAAANRDEGLRMRPARSEGVDMTEPSAPGTLDWSVRGDFTAILDGLGFSLALSVRPDAVVFLGADGGRQTLTVVPVPRAMGLATEGRRLAVASDRAVAVFVDTPELAPHHPVEPGRFDAYYVARTIHLTGPGELHDLAFDGDRLLATNTRFSCICAIDGSFSFVPLWHPPFISRLCPEDRCHLNGFVMEGGEIRYATSLSGSDERNGWRRDPDRTGRLIDARTGRTLRRDLCMPHSPRIVDGRLYVLNGGEGEVLEIDVVTGADRRVARLPGFTHGLAHHDGYLFVGLSYNRVSRAANPPPVARRYESLFAGVVAIETGTGRIAGSIEFAGGVSEVYDVQVLPGVRRAGLQGLDVPDGHFAVDTPHAKFWVTRN